MKSRGTLTPAQQEIVEILWEADSALTAGEVWRAVNEKREVARSTVQTLIDRLVKRGWLLRDEKGAKHTFEAVCSPGEAEVRTAKKFLSDYFEGSASRMVLSLLGSEEISEEEVKRLRKIFDEHQQKGSGDV